MPFSAFVSKAVVLKIINILLFPSLESFVLQGCIWWLPEYLINYMHHYPSPGKGCALPNSVPCNVYASCATDAVHIWMVWMHMTLATAWKWQPMEVHSKQVLIAMLPIAIIYILLFSGKYSINNNLMLANFTENKCHLPCFSLQ